MSDAKPLAIHITLVNTKIKINTFKFYKVTRLLQSTLLTATQISPNGFLI